MNREEFNGASRQDRELAVANKLDINVDRIGQAEFSDSRLSQLFDKASKADQSDEITARAFFATFIGGFAALGAGAAAGYDGLVIGGAVSLFASCILAPGLNNTTKKLKESVETEIDEKLAEKVAPPEHEM